MVGVVGLAAFIALAVLILLARDWISDGWSRRPAARAAFQRDLTDRINRLLSPQWALYEAHLRRQIPPEVRALYENRDLLLQTNVSFDETHWLTTFVPLDEQSVLDYRHFKLDVMPFADFNGDIVYLRPGGSGTGPSVDHVP
jgi:hypothetical protein